MPRILGAVTLAALGLAFTAHADDPLGNRADGQPLVVADSPLELPAVERVPRKARTGWLQDKLDSARSALKGHKLVVTSSAAEARTFTYDDVAKAADAAAAKLADAAASETVTRRVDLDLPQRPNRDGDLTVKVTGDMDTVGVLVSKKM